MGAAGRLGLLLLMFCAAMTANAGGFFTEGAWDLKIQTTGGNYETASYVYIPATTAESCRWVGAGNGESAQVEEVSLGEISALTIERININTWGGSVSDLQTIVEVVSNNSAIKSYTYTFSSIACERNTSDDEYVYDVDANILSGLSLTSGSSYKVKFYHMAKFDGSNDYSYLSNNSQNYYLNFTYVSKEATANFGNVPYGESRDVEIDVSSLGVTGTPSASGTTAGGAWPEYFSVVSGDASTLVVRFTPSESLMNLGANNTALNRSDLVVAYENATITLTTKATTYTPIIASKEVTNIDMNSADFSGVIQSGGCENIVEYGVYYSTSDTFDSLAWNKAVLATGQVLSSFPHDIAATTVKGLASGTTYYYRWYMKDATGLVTLEHDEATELQNFSTPAAKYRVIVRNLSNSSDTYLGVTYDETDNTKATATMFIGCAEYRYGIRYTSDGTNWTTVKSGTVLGSRAMSNITFHLSGLSDTSSATAALDSISNDAPDYTYAVYFYNSDGSQLTYSDGSAVKIEVAEGVSSTLRVGSGNTLTSLPAGSMYMVYQKSAESSVTGDSCNVGSGNCNHTGTLGTGETLLVSYQGGANSATFVLTSAYWVYSGKSGPTGTSKSDANTMEYVTCGEGGIQGDMFAGDYVLIFEKNKGEWTSGDNKFSYFDIKDANSNTLASSTDESYVGNANNYASYVLYAYASGTKTAYFGKEVYRVAYTYSDGTSEDVADIYLGLTGSDGTITYTAMPPVQGSEHIYQLSDIDLSGYTAANIYASRPWGTEAAWGVGTGTREIIWRTANMVLSGVTKGSFTYNLKSNCLTVDADGLSLDKTYNNGHAIMVGDGGAVTVKVVNNSEETVASGDYQIQLYLNGERVYLQGSNVSLASGESSIRTANRTVDPTNYRVEAYLTQGGFEIDSDQLVNCSPTTVGDTVYYYINNTYTEDDLCQLRFTTISAALSNLRSNSTYYEDATTNLLYHVVFEVNGEGSTYAGNTTTSITGGDVTGSVTMLQQINNGDMPTGGYKRFILRNSNAENRSVAMPVIEHIVIRNSKAITLDHLNIVGTKPANTDTYTNAIDIDDGASVDGKINVVCDACSVGRVTNADIVIQGCEISSSGFTCIHASGYDGITLIDNYIDAMLKIDATEGTRTNSANWGASLKFVRCKNIKMLRNTMTGQHVTGSWLQACDGVLLMNNVFWADNDFDVSSYKSNTNASVRLISQTGVTNYPSQNVGIYYNTFYVSENSVNQMHNFLRFGGNIDGQLGNATSYKNVEFMYNNCYAYGQYPNTAASDPIWKGQAVNITVDKNNYYADADSIAGRTESSIFAVTQTGTSGGTAVAYMIKVKDHVCQQTASSPRSMVIKGGALNIGNKISTDISGLGAEDIDDDRLNQGNRPSDGTKWTLGAYQNTAMRAALGTIVWNGTSDRQWDNRNNWKTLDGRNVDCLDTFADTLRVIIPKADSKAYVVPTGGIKNFPRVPNDFTSETDRPQKKYNEHVSAGQKDKDKETETSTKYFHSLTLEPGAKMSNSYRLYETYDDGTEVRRYQSASTQYVADRGVYKLTGAMIKPFSNSAQTAVRNVMSGDYYLNKMPQVHMKQASVDNTVEDGNVSWDVPFASLAEEITPDKQMAVLFSKLYGDYYLTSDMMARFYPSEGIAASDSTKQMTLSFTGWFVAEKELPTYTVNNSGYTLLNNYMPCNLLAMDVYEGWNLTDLKYYDEDSETFRSITDLSEADKIALLIQPRHGFLVKLNESGTSGTTNKTITETMITSSDTVRTTRSALAQNPKVRLKVRKQNTNYGSESVITINPDVTPENRGAYAIDKLFNSTSDMDYIPEIYIYQDGKYYENAQIGSEDEVVTLGLRVRSKIDVEIEAIEIDGIDECWLEDKQNGSWVDLTNFKAQIPAVALPVGDYQDRFFVHFKRTTEEPEPVVPGTEEEGKKTEVEENEDGSASILVSNRGSVLTVRAIGDVSLQKVYVTDMAGLTYEHDASGSEAVIKLPEQQGVYIVNVQGDKASATHKVLVQ